MDIQLRRAAFPEIESLRAGYRQEAGCQIVHDSILGRGLGDPYLILVDGRPAGYGGVWNEHYPGRVMEFHTLPEWRADAPSMFRALLDASGATHAEAQTNMPLMLGMLHECCGEITEENILFADGPETRLTCPGGVFRRNQDGEEHGLDGEWVIELDGEVVAAGGVLHHYNPPYGDIYMEVREDRRRQGIGSFLVQELRRVCRDSGKTPAARCDPGNQASQRTLLRAGMVECGRMLAGEVKR